MELKIYSPQDTGFIQKIDWNYDELKKEIAAAIESYANSVYTDDMIKKAKEDRAKLNKVSDALKKERTRIRKKLLEPDEQFGKEIQELTGMIQKAASNIDDQIKGYEERLREEKTAKVREFYEDNIHDIGKYLPFERVMQPRYALASTTMKSIKEEILALIQKVDEGLAVLNEVDSPYVGDMKKVFLETCPFFQVAFITRTVLLGMRFHFCPAPVHCFPEAIGVLKHCIVADRGRCFSLLIILDQVHFNLFIQRIKADQFPFFDRKHVQFLILTGTGR